MKLYQHKIELLHCEKKLLMWADELISILVQFLPHNLSVCELIYNTRDHNIYLTIIPWACAGYEMVAQVRYHYPISNKREWNNCFIKNKHPNNFIIWALQLLSLTCIPIIFVVHGIWAHLPWPVNQSKLWNCNTPWLIFNNKFIYYQATYLQYVLVGGLFRAQHGITGNHRNQ